MTCPTRATTDLEAFLLDSRSPVWEAFRAHYPGCAECSAELAAWSELEEALRVAAAPNGFPHPSEARLLAFRDDPAGLAPPDRDSIRDHLRTCAACRDGLAAVPALEIRQPGQAPAPLRAGPRRPLRSLGRWVPTLVLAAAAVLLLLLPLAWLLRARLDRALDPVLQEPAPEVAVTQPPPSPDLPPPGSTENSSRPAVEGEARAPVPPARPKPAHEAAQQAPTPSEPHPKEAPRVLASPSGRPATSAPAAPKRAPAARPPAAREEPDPSRVLIVAALAASSPPVYVPPVRAAPALRVAGGTRSTLADLPKLLVLAPEHEGFTASESPTLYWFVSRETNHPCEFVLTHPDREDPVVEVAIPAPLSAGIHAVRLADHGIVLEPGTSYRWFVSLVSDPGRRSSDVVAGGAIRRVPLDEKVRAELAEGGPARTGHVYARNGLFYDALAFVSRWIEEAPDEPRLREQRAALLEQVGLGEATGARQR